MLEIMDTDYQSSNMPKHKVLAFEAVVIMYHRLAHQTLYLGSPVAINTDQMVLDKSEADTCITIGKKLTGGFGAGGNPEIAYAAAEESADEIKEIINDANMYFLPCMGGGVLSTAILTDARPREFTVAVVTTPFSFENPNRSDTLQNTES